MKKARSYSLKSARPILGDGTTDSENIQAIDKIIKVTGGHPLSLEIIASNIDSIHDLKKMADEMQIKIGELRIYNPDERLRSLQASFDYTVDGLGEKLKGLLLRLTIFNSPFPVEAPVRFFLLSRMTMFMMKMILFNFTIALFLQG